MLARRFSNPGRPQTSGWKSKQAAKHKPALRPAKNGQRQEWPKPKSVPFPRPRHVPRPAPMNKKLNQPAAPPLQRRHTRTRTQAPKRPRHTATQPWQIRQRLTRLLLRFREQIQGPENAPIARFDGLGCYQTRSEKTMLRKAQAVACAATPQAALKPRPNPHLPHPRADCQPAPDPARRLQSPRTSINAHQRLHSLQKQEQIKGPENAPIARFDGLCCYQVSSKKNARSGKKRLMARP